MLLPLVTAEMFSTRQFFTEKEISDEIENHFRKEFSILCGSRVVSAFFQTVENILEHIVSKCWNFGHGRKCFVIKVLCCCKGLCWLLKICECSFDYNRLNTILWLWK